MIYNIQYHIYTDDTQLSFDLRKTSASINQLKTRIPVYEHGWSTIN